MREIFLIFALVCLGPITAHAQTNPPAGSSLANVTATNWTNITGTLTTSGISDPSGGTNAGRLSNGASQGTAYVVHSLSQTVAAGDVLMAGVWTRINSGSSGTGFPGTITVSGCTATYAATGYSSTLGLPATVNTSSWSWTSVAVKVITVSSNPCSLSLSLVSAASAATDFYAPVFFYVPVGTMQDNKILTESQNLQNYSLTCTSPAITAPPSGCLPATAQNTAGIAGPNPQFGDWTIGVTSGGAVYARNNATGAIDASGTDTAVVVNALLTINAGAGGHILLKRPPAGQLYNANSATEETATGCNNFGGSGNKLAWVIGFPSTTPYSSGVQWTIEGETAGIWQGEAGSTSANTTGVYINVTSAAISSVTANDVLAGFFQRPVNNCTLTTGGTNVSNEVIYKNIGVRFPANTRGNEVGFLSYFAATVGYQGTIIADFAQPYNTIATGSAPAVGSWNSVGTTGSLGGSGDWQHWENIYATGFNVCHDFEEHSTATSVTSIYCNYAGEVGLVGNGVYHAGTISKFNDQENLHGLVFGAAMVQGSRFDIKEYDIELGIANWYARTTPNLVETNPGYTSGVIWWSMSSANTGFANNQTTTLFSSGGNNFQSFPGQGAPNIAISPASDTFTRPNTSPSAGTNGLGPAWANGTQTGNVNLKISSNSAVVASSAGTGAGYSAYIGTAFNPDQSSQVVVSTLASGVNAVEAACRMSTNPAVQTYYSYYDGGNAALGRGIVKVLAGSGSTLVSQSSAAGAAGDTIEIDCTGSNPVTITALRNGAPDTSLNACGCVQDSSSPITSGQPGILVLAASNGAAAATNWRGGQLPTKTGVDSIYGQPGTFTQTQQFLNGLTPKVYTVSTLPSASSVLAGTQLEVSDATTFTPGTCTGGGSDYMIAVSNGSSWSCH